mmetsp:Transcript_24106/g.52186  ORF Transcript_24106/g.52186 Transcript_24106/m.52186 type:complete len:311 (-) Transcript_24106:228-1160(-)
MRACAPLSACTSITSCRSRCMVLSPAADVASTSINPFCTTAPLLTLSPTRFCTGTDSPVSADSSTTASPLHTSPSARIISPARTASTAPASTSSAGIEVPSANCALEGAAVAEASCTALRNRSITAPSMSSAEEKSVTTREASKYSPVATAPTMARSISTLMSSECLTSRATKAPCIRGPTPTAVLARNTHIEERSVCRKRSSSPTRKSAATSRQCRACGKREENSSSEAVSTPPTSCRLAPMYFSFSSSTMRAAGMQQATGQCLTTAYLPTMFTATCSMPIRFSRQRRMMRSSPAQHRLFTRMRVICMV